MLNNWNIRKNVNIMHLIILILLFIYIYIYVPLNTESFHNLNIHCILYTYIDVIDMFIQTV